MRTSTAAYQDGYYGAPRRISRTPMRYPFAGNGDITTAEYDAVYVVDIGKFTPMARGTVDPEKAGFYLIDESKPDISNGDLATFTRTYSKIPLQQVIPSTRYIQKPGMVGPFPKVSGSALIIQPEENVPRWIFFSRIPVSSDSGVPTGASPTGGTYTVIVGASTSSPIAFNASAATLQSTLNALPSVATYGSFTVTGNYTSGFTITFAGYTAGSVNTASLTGSFGYTGASLRVTVAGGTNMFFFLDALPSDPSGFGLAVFSGGTFAISIFGQTTAAISYDATLADVQAAILALSNVPAGTTVTSFGTAGYDDIHILRRFGPYTGQQIGFVVRLPGFAVTANGSSLTPSGSAATATASSSTVTSLRFTGVNLGIRVLSVPGSDIADSDDIILTQGANYRTISSGLFTVGTGSITLTSISGAAYSDSTPITFVGKQVSVYTADSKETRVKYVTDFYLPGVSPGISSSDDIPLEPYEGDDASLLEAIFSGDTVINKEVGDLEQYKGGPMLMRRKMTLNPSTL